MQIKLKFDKFIIGIKNTFLGRYLSYYLCHPLCHKISTIYGLVNKAILISSEISEESRICY